MPYSNSSISVSVARFMHRHSKCLILVVAVFTIFFLWSAVRHVRIDASGVSFSLLNTEKYQVHKKFEAAFGTDDYILMAVTTDLKPSDPAFLIRNRMAAEKLLSLESVQDVTGLGTIETALMQTGVPADQFRDSSGLSQLREYIPGLRHLISEDFKTVGFMVRLDNERLNGFEFEKKLKEMKQILKANYPETRHCYAAGIPVLRAVFERYNLNSALSFGALGLVFGFLIAFYLFKTFKAGIMVMLAGLTGMIWVAGIMSVSGVGINLATGLSFGFILVASTTTAFHLIVHYYRFLDRNGETVAAQKCLEACFRPCFMCAVTTSAGFLSLITSPVKMIHQAGFIISFGIILSFFLTMLFFAFMLPRYFPFQNALIQKIRSDALSPIIKQKLTIGFSHPRIALACSTLCVLFLAAGIPHIESIKHLTTPLIGQTQESSDFKFVETHLNASGASFSIVLSPEQTGYTDRQFWYNLYKFEKNLNLIPGVMGVESMTPFIFKIALQPSPAGVKPEKVFQQMMIHMEDQNILRPYFDPDSKSYRMIVHIHNTDSDQIERIIDSIEPLSLQMLGENIRVVLSGQLMLLRDQTIDIVGSQLKTIFLVLLVITLLMMIQLRSMILGLLSLIPNLFPIVTIFGIMGWADIALDPLTVFAVVISYGLSVDDSIHFLTRLKREISTAPESFEIHTPLLRAYEKTARALLSTTLVLLFSASGLLLSPFQHVASLGVLVGAAALAALAGDLIIMPAVILTFKPLSAFISSPGTVVGPKE